MIADTTIFRITEYDLLSMPIIDGRYYFCTDSRKLYSDTDNTRLIVTPIINVNTEVDRQYNINPSLGTYYYILETNELWLFNGKWIVIVGTQQKYNGFYYAQDGSLSGADPVTVTDNNGLLRDGSVVVRDINRIIKGKFYINSDISVPEDTNDLIISSIAGGGIKLVPDGVIDGEGTLTIISSGTITGNPGDPEVTTNAKVILNEGDFYVRRNGVDYLLTSAYTLAPIALSGSWNDLVDIPEFATVAFSGSYNDLTDRPTPYQLPIASASTLGGIKVGDNLTIDANGVLSATGGGGGGGGADKMDKVNPTGSGSLSIDRLANSYAGVNSAVLASGVDTSVDVNNEPFEYIDDGKINTVTFTSSLDMTEVGEFNTYVTFTDYTNIFVLPIIGGHFNESLEKYIYQLDNSIDQYTFSTATEYVITNYRGSTKSIASGDHSVAIGINSEAEGDFSLVIGENNIASDNYSVSIGFRNTSDNASIAMGVHNDASGMNSLAVGFGNTASGSQSVALGNNNIASGANSVAMGYDNSVDGDYSAAIGQSTIASGNNQFVRGKYNIEDEDDEYLEIVGNGLSDSSRSNAHTLGKSGNAWFAGDVKVGSPPVPLAKEKEVKLGIDEWINTPGYGDYTNYLYDSVGSINEYLNGCTKDSGNIPINATVVYDVPTGWNQIQFNINDSTILNAIAGKTIEFGACTYTATFTTTHYFEVRYKDAEGDHYLFLDSTGGGSQNFTFNSSGVSLVLTVPSNCEYITVYYAAGTHTPIATAGKLTLTNIYAFDINEHEIPDIYNTTVTLNRYDATPVNYSPNTINFLKDGSIKVVNNLGSVFTYCRFALLSYGHSTWAEFISAYKTNSIVYCRASSNANPGTGSQTRLAFMAYVNNADNPTEVEFQYYRSVQSHSNNQQGDQVFVYKLTSASGGTWTVIMRESYTKIVAGTGLSGSYSNGVLTLTPSSAISGVWTNAQTAAVGATTITITDNSITSSSIIDVKTQNSAGVPIIIESIIATTGSVTITFEELEYATDFRLWIRNV